MTIKGGALVARVFSNIQVNIIKISKSRMATPHTILAAKDIDFDALNFITLSNNKFHLILLCLPLHNL